MDPVKYVARFTGHVLIEIGNAIAGMPEAEQVQPVVVHIGTLNVTGTPAEVEDHLMSLATARGKIAGLMWPHRRNGMGVPE